MSVGLHRPAPIRPLTGDFLTVLIQHGVDNRAGVVAGLEMADAVGIPAHGVDLDRLRRVRGQMGKIEVHSAGRGARAHIELRPDIGPGREERTLGAIAETLCGAAMDLIVDAGVQCIEQYRLAAAGDEAQAVFVGGAGPAVVVG